MGQGENIPGKKPEEDLPGAMREMFDAFSDGVLVTDSELGLVFANPSMREAMESAGSGEGGASLAGWIARRIDEGGPELRDALLACAREKTAEDGIVVSLPPERFFMVNVHPAPCADAKLGLAVSVWREEGGIQDARKQLETYRRRHGMAISGDNIGVWELELGALQLYLDPSIRRLFGFDDSEAPAGVMEWNDLIHPDDQGHVVAEVKKLMAGECDDILLEYRILHREHGAHWVQVRGRTVQDHLGNPMYLVGTIMDIDARKQAEEEVRRANEDLDRRVRERTEELSKANWRLQDEIQEKNRIGNALRVSEERLELVLEGAELGLWDWDLLTDEACFNERFATMLGLSLEEVGDKMAGAMAVIHPGDLPEVQAAWRAHYRGESDIYESRFRARTKNGGWVWILARGKIVERGNGGEPLRATGTHLDITEMKSSESRLAGQLAFMETMLDTIPSPIFYKDREGVYIGCNRGFEDMMGLSREEVVGSRTEDISPSELAEVYAEMDRRLIGERGFQRYESGVRFADGKVHDVIFNKATFSGPDEEVAGIVGVVTDITERKRIEEATSIQRDLGILLGENVDFQAALELSTDAMLKISGMECGGIYLLDHETGRLELAHHRGLPEGFVDMVRSYEPDEENVRLILEGESIYTTFKELGARSSGDADAEELRSLAVIPIHHQGKVIGCFNLASTRDEQVPLIFQAALEATGAQIGSALIRIKAERELEDQKNFLQRIINSVTEGIFVLDPDGNFVMLNPAAEGVLGNGDSEWIGKKPDDSIRPSDRPLTNDAFNMALNGDSVEFETNIENPRRGLRRLMVRLSPLELEGGPSVLGVARDITESANRAEELRQSRERLDLALQGADLGMWDWSLEKGEIVRDERWAAMLGYGPGEVENTLQSFLDLVPEEDIARAAEAVKEYFAGNRPRYEAELRLRTRDGGHKWLLVRGKVVERGEDGRPLRMTGTHFDITDRKDFENELARRLEYERGLASCSHALQDYGLGPDEARDKALGALLEAARASRVYIFENFEDPDDGLCMMQTAEVCAPGVEAQMENNALAKVPYGGDFERWRERLGSGKPVVGMVGEFPPGERAILEPQGIRSILVIPVMVDNQWHGFIGFDDVEEGRLWSGEDIRLLRTAAEMIGSFIERRKATEALADSERRYRALFDNAADAIFVHRLDGAMLDVNIKAAERLGYSREELLSLTPRDFDSPEFAAKLDERMEALMERGSLVFDSAHVARDGKTIPTEISSSIIDYQGEKAILSVARDVSERIEAQRTILKEQTEVSRLKSLLENVINNLNSGLVVTDTSGKIMLINHSGISILGIAGKNALGASLDDIDDNLRHFRAPDLTLNDSSEIAITLPDGSEKPVGFNSSILFDQRDRVFGVVTLFRDLTDLKAQQKEDRRREKLATIGELAGGIAHEIKNPIFAITSGIQLLQAELELSEDQTDTFNIIFQETLRVDRLVRQLLYYSARHEPRISEVEASELIGEVTSLNQGLAQSRKVAISKSVPGDFPKLKIDRDKILQVMINLVQNAIEASRPGDEILVGAEMAYEGDVARLFVKDTGEGIPDELKAKIFDPFFSTKKSSTGMGLAISRNIVLDHEGDLTFESAPNKGATFMVRLPLR